MSKYDKTMMGTAELWAENATCSRLHVGCVMAKGDRIMVTGYNGAPSGLPHCDHVCNCDVSEVTDRKPDEEFFHQSFCKSGPENCKAVHAEQNAIAWAARNGVPLLGATCYTTHQPCLVCARLIVSAGIERVVYREEYRDPAGLLLLKQASLRVKHMPIEIDYNRVALLPHI